MLKKIAGSLLALTFAGLSWAQFLDLNKATEMELDGLKGVGPVLSREILSERKKTPFKDWDDVTRRVKGMGPHKAGSLSEQGVRVQGSAYAGKAQDKTSTQDGAKNPGKSDAPRPDAAAAASKATPTKN